MPDLCDVGITCVCFNFCFRAGCCLLKLAWAAGPISLLHEIIIHHRHLSVHVGQACLLRACVYAWMSHAMCVCMDVGIRCVCFKFGFRAGCCLLKFAWVADPISLIHVIIIHHRHLSVAISTRAFQCVLAILFCKDV